MARKLIVQPATLRDASYVTANMRPEDEVEVLCQLPDNTKRHELAYALLMSGDAFVVLDGRDPIAFFGTQPLNVACLVTWAIGTPEIQRAVPAINRFMLRQHLPDRMAQGFLTMEARAHADNRGAHRWLQSMGGRPLGGPFEFGKSREKFLLFRWTADDFKAIRARRGRSL